MLSSEVAKDNNSVYFVSKKIEGVGIKGAELKKIPVAEKCPNYRKDCDRPNKYNQDFSRN
jgi:hypothetical protein